MASAAALLVSGTGTTTVSSSIGTVSNRANSSPSALRVKYTLRPSKVLATLAK